MTPLQRRAQAEGFYQVAARALNVSAAGLTDASSPETVSGWDSLRSILLVTAVEERYRTKLTLAEIMSIRTLGDLRAALKSHGVDIGE